MVASRENARIEEVLPHLTHLRKQLDRYVGRATTLLEVSRLQSHTIDLELVVVDAGELVRETIAENADLIARVGAKVEVVAPSVRVRADRDALAQIVENLLSNALNHGGGAPVSVELALTGERAQLTVRDHGPGISTEDQARIFGAFERVMTTRRSGGFGVGLWIVRRVAEAMGGSVEVTSTPGSGATFTVNLLAAGENER